MSISYDSQRSLPTISLQTVRTRRFRELTLFSAVLLLVCGGGILASGAGTGGHQRRTQPRSRRAEHRPRRRGKTATRQPEILSINDGDEDLEGRQSWFLFQRTYPFGSIPVNARRAAWESRPLRGKGEAQFESVTTPVWQSLGPTPTLPYFQNFGFNSGRINALAVSPTDANVILAGASTGGIWRSTDGG